MSVLTVNCGSSSLKWSVVDPPETLASGTVQQVTDHAAALTHTLDAVEQSQATQTTAAVSGTSQPG